MVRNKKGQRKQGKNTLRCYLGVPKGSGNCDGCMASFECQKYDRAFNGRHNERIRFVKAE